MKILLFQALVKLPIFAQAVVAMAGLCGKQKEDKHQTLSTESNWNNNLAMNREQKILSLLDQVQRAGDRSTDRL